MVIWALVSLLFLQVALSSVLNMRRAANNFAFREAAIRSQIRERGKFKEVKWEKRGNTVILKKDRREIKLKREEEDERIRIFPR